MAAEVPIAGRVIPVNVAPRDISPDRSKNSMRRVHGSAANPSIFIISANDGLARPSTAGAVKKLASSIALAKSSRTELDETNARLKLFSGVAALRKRGSGTYKFRPQSALAAMMQRDIQRLSAESSLSSVPLSVTAADGTDASDIVVGTGDDERALAGHRAAHAPTLAIFTVSKPERAVLCSPSKKSAPRPTSGQRPQSSASDASRAAASVHSVILSPPRRRLSPTQTEAERRAHQPPTPRFEEHRIAFLQSMRSKGVDVTNEAPRRFCHLSLMQGIDVSDIPPIEPPPNERVLNARHDIEMTKLAETHLRKKSAELLKKRLQLQRAERRFWASNQAPDATRTHLELVASRKAQQHQPQGDDSFDKQAYRSFLRNASHQPR